MSDDAGPIGRRNLQALVEDLQAVTDSSVQGQPLAPTIAAGIARVQIALDLCAEALEHSDLGARVALETLAHDLTQIQRLLRPSNDPASIEKNSAMAALVADRIVYTLGLATRARAASDQAPPVEAQSITEALSSLSADYGADASRQRGVMMGLYVAFGALVAVAVGIAWKGLEHPRDATAGFQFEEFTAYGLVALSILLLSLLIFREAARHRQNASESLRLQRQLMGFEAYVAPMPRRARDLLRGTMVQQLFPRVLESDEPWRVPNWPSAEAILAALPPGAPGPDSGSKS